jgi:hypothetical protein
MAADERDRTMHWDNVGVSCCSAAVKDFVQRTITQGKHARPALKLRRNALNLSISAAKSLTSCLP